MSQSNASGMTFMEKLSTFIVDKRSLIFLITIIGLLFSAVSRSWVEVENDLTYYLPDDSQTKQALAVMDEEFITYGTAEVMAANVTPAQAEKLAAQIREVEGVQSVDYDKTTDHYNALSALFSVTFAYDEDDDACLTSLEAVKELLSSYDLYISTDLGNTLRETIDHEISIIMIYVAIVIVLVLLLVMLIGACVGLINGFVMAKFKVHPYIITLAMQMIVYGIYLTVSNSVQVGSFDSSYTTSFVTKPLFQIQTGVRPNGTAIFTVVPMYVLLALIVTALMWVVWNKTAFGKNMFAVGSNEEAARVSGVNVMMTIIGVFMVAGALYGYTGFIEAARMGSSTATLGLNYEADAISAAVIGGVSFVGGTGRISGVVLGVFMMQLIIAGMTFLGISGNVTYIVKGAVILFAVILDMRKYMTRK